jgi:hypothetical protein
VSWWSDARLLPNPNPSHHPNPGAMHACSQTLTLAITLTLTLTRPTARALCTWSPSRATVLRSRASGALRAAARAARCLRMCWHNLSTRADALTCAPGCIAIVLCTVPYPRHPGRRVLKMSTNTPRPRHRSTTHLKPYTSTVLVTISAAERTQRGSPRRLDLQRRAHQGTNHHGARAHAPSCPLPAPLFARNRPQRPHSGNAWVVCATSVANN